MCEQVSRLSFNPPRRLPILRGQWLMPHGQLHGYWDSPEISSVFPLTNCQRNKYDQAHTVHFSASLAQNLF